MWHRANGGAAMDVGGWLRRLGLERYEAAFRENEISERVLPSLTQEDLKEIGVGPVGHRRVLLEAIAALRDDKDANAASANLAVVSNAANVSPEDRAERRQVTVMLPSPALVLWNCRMRRREFFKFLGNSAVAWPLVAHAQSKVYRV